MLAIIGGSGWSEFDALQGGERPSLVSAYGEASADVLTGTLNVRGKSSAPLCFLPRHGTGHRLPPHRINYRANIDLLAQCGVCTVIAINAVGACNTRWQPGELILPDQVIDYTYAREHTFHETLDDFSAHIDFTEPLKSDLRAPLHEAAVKRGISLHDGGTYGCTQGPRFESAAEIRRLQRDGCDLVGMTLMPEAALCRERGMQYLSICMVVNPAAGVAGRPIAMREIESAMQSASASVRELLLALLVDDN